MSQLSFIKTNSFRQDLSDKHCILYFKFKNFFEETKRYLCYPKQISGTAKNVMVLH